MRVATQYAPPLSSPRRAPPSRRNVAYVPTLTAAAALRVKAALSKAACYLELLTLKVLSESRVTWTTSVPILVFLGFSLLELRPMYVIDRRQTSDKSIA